VFQSFASNLKPQTYFVSRDSPVAQPVAAPAYRQAGAAVNHGTMLCLCSSKFARRRYIHRNFSESRETASDT